MSSFVGSAGSIDSTGAPGHDSHEVLLVDAAPILRADLKFDAEGFRVPFFDLFWVDFNPVSLLGLSNPNSVCG